MLCTCNKTSADYLVLGTIGRDIGNGLMEVGLVDWYVCKQHMPYDTNELLSQELSEEGWQVYSVVVGSKFPNELH